MPESVSKSLLRQQLRQRLRQLSAEERRAQSHQLCQRLLQQDCWQQAERVLFYAPLADEPDVLPLLDQARRQRKRIGLPRHDDGRDEYQACEITDWQQQVVRGQFGIPEPNPSCASLLIKRLDLVLVPGLGFGPAGERLGRGRGFYDRLLGSIPGIKCGVAFDCQMLVAVPLEAHDVRVHCVVTPTRWLQVSCEGQS